MSSTHTCAQNAQKSQTFYKPGSWALEGGVKASLDFEIFSQKKYFFLVLSWQKQISPLLALPWRNPLVAPPFGRNPSEAY